MIEATGGGWRSGPLRVARAPVERRLGLRPRPDGRGLVLRCRSVHSLFMAEPLGVASLDAAGRVRRAGVLPPFRVFFDPGACFVLEVPLARGLPRVGTMLVAVARSATHPAAGALLP